MSMSVNEREGTNGLGIGVPPRIHPKEKERILRGTRDKIFYFYTFHVYPLTMYA